MNRFTRRYLVVLITLVLGSILPTAVADEEEARARRTVVENLERLLPAFDRNGDRRLNEAERRTLERAIDRRYGPKWLRRTQRVLREADRDGDGVLTEPEWIAYRTHVAATRPEQAPPRNLPRLRTVMIPMSDGIRLATDLYLPRRGKGPWPVILKRTPYGRHKTSARWDGAGVVQDMRGRFDSEGWNFPFVGCGWVSHQDGKETIEWIRRQPWCDGRVLTAGGSALGITQHFLAASQPEGLVAQYIQVAVADLYRHAAYVGGAFRKSLVEGWLRGNHFDPKAVDVFKAHYEYDAFWARYDALAHPSKINVPAVHVGGWFDTFALGTIEAFRARQHQGGEGARGRQFLVMGPWTHGVNQPLLFPVAGKPFPNFQIPQAYTLEAWIERILRHRENSARPLKAVAYYVMGDTTDPDAPGNAWRLADDWPVPHQPTAFYFHAGGRLSNEPPRAADDDHFIEYTFDPADPCPTRGGCLLSEAAGPQKQNDVERRADVITFTTDPLSEPIEVTGHPEVHIFLSSSAVDTDLSVRLTDVYPDGSSYLMAEGMLRVRYRHSFEKATLLKPGKVYPIRFALWPTSIVFNRGHRIRVAVTSSNFPRFDVNPGTGKPWREGEHAVKQRNRIHVSATHASHIVLPIVPPH